MVNPRKTKTDLLSELETLRSRVSALEQSEKRLLDFADISSDWFWETGPDHKFTSISPRREWKYAWESNKIIGETRWERERPDTLHVDWERHKADLDAHRPFFDFTLPVWGVGGSVRYLSANGKPVFDKDGSFLGYRGTGADITPEVEAREAARLARTRLEDAIESIPTTFFLFDADERLQLFNSKAKEFFPEYVEVIRNGATFEDIIRFGAESGLVSEAEGRVEQWVEDRLAAFRDPPEFIEVRLHGGRWLKCFDRRVSDGGRVSIRVDVTDLKEREAKIRASEERYRDLVEGSIQGIGVHREGQPLFANDELARIFGYESSQAIMELDSILSLYPEKEHQAHRSRWEARLAGRSVPKSMELLGVKRDGSEVWVQCLVTAIHWEGEPAIQSTYIDITERKRAEEALRESEARFRRLVDTMNDGFYVLDADDRISYVNDAYCLMVRHGADELLGQPISMLRAPEEHPKLKERLASRRLGNNEPYETQFTHRDGQFVAVLVSPHSMFDREGTYQGNFSVVTDITKRKQAEEALRQSEERYRGLIEGSIQGIGVQRDGKPLFANDEMARIFGYESSRAIMELDSILSLFPKKEHRAHRSRWESRLAGRSVPRSMELQGVKRDGSEVWVQCLSTAVHWEGEPAIQTTYIDITERKQAEAALRESEAKYRLIIEDSLQPTLLLRADRLEFVNQAAADLYGFHAPDEMIGTSIDDLVAGHELDRVRAYRAARLLGENPPARYVYQAVRKNGESIWVEIFVQLVTWEGKQAFQATHRDITEQKMAAEALRESQERYRDLVEGSLEGILIHKNFKIVFANPAMADMTGRDSVNELLELPSLLTLVSPEEHERIEGYKNARMAGEEVPTHIEIECLRKDGSPFSVDVKSRIVDWKGEPAIQTTMYDITDRKRAERALAENEAYLASILNTAVDGIITITDSGIVETFNDAAAKMFGYGPQEIIGRKINVLMPTPHAEDHDKYLQHYLKTGQTRIIGMGREVTARRKDGSDFPLALAVSEVRVGDRRAFTGIVRDITGIKRIEEQLIEASQAKSAFISNMSHELRTPLNAIIGFTQLLMRDQDITERQMEDLKIISTSGDHLLELINDVLDMHKIEAGKLEVNREQFDLHHTLSTIADMFRLRCDIKNLDLHLEIDPAVSHYVHGDQRKLRQILINLLGNAVKFTEQGQIRLTVKGAAETIHFSVRDTGSGLTSEDLQTILEPFRQAHYGQEGTGLGLAITKNFVELLGGTLEVESAVGKGSEFSFAISLPPLGDNTGANMDLPDKIVGLMDDRSTRIMIVDDDPTTRRYLTETLGAIGFSTAQATNGKEAIERVATFYPDLVLMDIRMPVMDGLEATRRIVACNDSSTPIIVALTAGMLDTPREDLIEAGCREVIPKPFDEEVLLKTIGGLLGIQYRYRSTTRKFGEPKSELLALDRITRIMRKTDRDELMNAFRIGDRDTMMAIALVLAEDAESSLQEFGKTLTELLSPYREYDLAELLIAFERN